MSKDNEKVFDPTEAIGKVAELRVLGDEHKKGVDGCRSDLERTEQYKVLESAEENWNTVEMDLGKAIAELKAGCEAIFDETDEKEYPGGKIKVVTGLEYDPDSAVRWAAKLAVEKGEFYDLLKLDVQKFKAQCKGVTPPFVKKTKVGRFYIDSDLSEYLEGGGDG